MIQTEQQTRLAFRFAPNIKHESIAKMSQAQKDEALHEFIDLRNITREKIFAPSASPQTRIFALCTIYDRAQKTATKRPDGTRVLEAVTQQVPTWIGDKDQEGSLSYRYGMSRNSISNELDAYEKAGLVKRFYPPSDDGKSHLAVSVTPELLTNSELLPTKGERPRRKTATCKDCGSPDLRRKTVTTVTCSDCGCIQSHSEHTCMVNEEDDGTEEAVFPNTPPAVENEASPTEEETEQDQQPLCTRDVQYVIEIEYCTRDVHNVLSDWLQKRIGYGGQIFATGRPNSQDKYLSFNGPFHIDSYLAGDRENIYGSQLRQVDGKTWVWSADIDTRDKEVYSRLDEFLSRLASAGAFPIAWLRSDGSAHVEIYFSETVLPEEADAWIFSIVPEFSALKERYPVTTTNKLSWPLYYRIGNKVYPCTARYMSDELHSLKVASDDITLHQLSILAEECITPAQLVHDYIRDHPIVKPDPKPQPTTHAPRAGGVFGQDLARQVIDEFNASHSWESLLGKPNRHGKYCASWRNDRTPNVAVDPRTDLAKDFSINAWIPRSMDKYQVYCFIEGRENWQEFKRRDLDERCTQLRETQEPDEQPQAQEQEHEQEEVPTTLFPEVKIQKHVHVDVSTYDGPIPPPNRQPYCECNKGWRWNGERYSCANLQCPDAERKAS